MSNCVFVIVCMCVYVGLCAYVCMFDSNSMGFYLCVCICVVSLYMCRCVCLCVVWVSMECICNVFGMAANSLHYITVYSYIN